MVHIFLLLRSLLKGNFKIAWIRIAFNISSVHTTYIIKNPRLKLNYQHENLFKEYVMKAGISDQCFVPLFLGGWFHPAISRKIIEHEFSCPDLPRKAVTCLMNWLFNDYCCTKVKIWTDSLYLKVVFPGYGGGLLDMK